METICKATVGEVAMAGSQQEPTELERKGEFWAKITRELGFPIIMSGFLALALWFVGQQHFSMMQSHLRDVTDSMRGFQADHARLVLILEKIAWRLDQIEKK